MKKYALLLLAALLPCFTLSAQDYSAEDSTIYERYIAQMNAINPKGNEDLLICTALFFEGTPYVASTLEKIPERLVVNLRELDCTTFAENVIALARTYRQKNHSFKAFCKNLELLRYRNGKVDGYTSRLHYISDWIYTNDRKGIVKDECEAIGQTPLTVKLNFMTRHPESYAPLKNNPQAIETMKKIEAENNARDHYYLPKSDIDKKGDLIHNGDMICFATSIDGLDATHVAIAYHRNGKLTFVHASASYKKVVVCKGTLSQFVEHNKSMIGLFVARPLFN
jgi:hypothetical protein